jgi:hypothetical protein
MVLVYDFRIRKPTNRSVVALDGQRLRELGEPFSSAQPAAPLLPLLGPILRLPERIRRPLIAFLPRTHMLWTWHL